jgi:large subunit ribosomal protein L19
MSFDLLQTIGEKQKKSAVLDIRSGDTVKVSQKIKEGDKFRIQIFEGVVINVTKKASHTARFTVRKVASGVGVEKSYLIHSPLIDKIEIVSRGKARRNYLSFLRERSGKSARLKAQDFNHAAVNTLSEPVAETPTEVPAAA